VAESVVVLNMIIAVFIEKTAEVLRELKDERRRKSAKSDGSHDFDVLPIPYSATVNDESVDVNWKDVRRCVLVLFTWESQNVISSLECRNGVNLILTNNWFPRIAKPILEGNLLLFQSVLRTSIGYV